jgi:hypothetical protein
MAAIVLSVLAQSPTGDRILYTNVGTAPGGPAGDLISTSLAVRGDGSWANMPLGYPYATPSAPSIANSAPAVFDSGLSSIPWLAKVPLTPDGPPEGDFHIYDTRFAPPRLLASVGSKGPERIRSSADAGRLVLQTEARLTPTAAGRVSGASIYSLEGDALSLVDVDSKGQLLSPCGSQLPRRGGLSRTGERIFFTHPALWESGSCGEPSAAYLHDSSGTTREISASECTRIDCNGPQNVELAGTTPSGSAALLITSQQLTDADTDELPDLYRYDVGAGHLELLSAGQGGDEASVLTGEVAASADGKRVYFYANGRLTAGGGSESGPNLYVAYEGGLRFLASLPSPATLEVDGDGGRILLTTDAPLREDDLDAVADVYLYDFAADAFTRLSRGDTGGNGPQAADIVPSDSTIFEWLPRLEAHSLSSDGRHAFFTTSEQLVAGDRNENADLYEWADGSAELLSSGTSDSDVTFLGASADGRTALFLTAQTLVGADRDAGEHDIYAARIGGGFSEPPPSPCPADSCFSPPSATRAQRPQAASQLQAGAARRGRLRVGRFLQTDVNRLLSHGSAALKVFVPGPGKVKAQLVFGLDAGGRAVIAHGMSGAVRRGPLVVTLEMDAEWRRRLAQTGPVRARLVVQQGRERALRQVLIQRGRSR